MVPRTPEERQAFLARPPGERVQEVGHRNYVGGVNPETWYGIGRLQYDFLISQGLRHDHRFLDVACGSLRLGQFLIPYLDEGCYMGLEGEQSLVEAGLEHELSFDLAKTKKPRFAFNYDFDVSSLGTFDWAIAQSLFTHLTAEDIARCFEQLAEAAAAGAVLFATYFRGLQGNNQPGPSHAQLAWFYQPEDIAELAAPFGWEVTNIGQWGHPRKQPMLRCERRTADERPKQIMKLFSHKSAEGSGKLAEAVKPAGEPVDPVKLAGENVTSAQHALIRRLSEFRELVGHDAYFLYDDNIGTINQPLLEGAQLLTDRIELLRRLPKGGRAMEVGTFRGHFALNILDILQPDELVIVDISFDLFDYDALKRHPLSSRVQQFSGNSYEVMGALEDASFDMIYIDANHMYEFISKELVVAHEKLRPGGYIVANDYTSYSPLNGHKYGVPKAVNEFVNQEGYAVRYFALQPGGYHDIAFQKPFR